jgi:hypothetical protein
MVFFELDNAPAHFIPLSFKRTTKVVQAVGVDNAVLKQDPGAVLLHWLYFWVENF